MRRDKRSKKSLFLSLITLGMLGYYFSFTFTWTLNKAIGWGWGAQEYFGIILLLIILMSLVFTLIAIKIEKLNIFNVISLITNSVTIFYVVKFYFLFKNSNLLHQ